MSRGIVRGLLTTTFLLALPGLAGAAGEERILLRSTGTREQMRNSIEALGGKVTHEFQNVNAVADGDWLAIPVVVPAGKARATFELGWKRNWSHTPTNDIDLYVIFLE